MNEKEVAQALACLEKAKDEALEASKKYQKCETPEDGGRFFQAYGAYVGFKIAIRQAKDAQKDLRELQRVSS